MNGCGWLPLNVLFTFAAAVGVIAALQRGQYGAAVLLFVGAGGLVDYAWPGVGLVLASWWFFRRPNWAAAAMMAVALSGICGIAGNPWAFLAIAPIGAATVYTPAVPRLRWFFWTFYPAHLALLWIARASLG